MSNLDELRKQMAELEAKKDDLVDKLRAMHEQAQVPKEPAITLEHTLSVIAFTVASQQWPRQDEVDENGCVGRA